MDIKEDGRSKEMKAGSIRDEVMETEKAVDSNFLKAGAISPSPGSAGPFVGSVRPQ